MSVKKKIIITGQKVHGVGYRLFLLDEAEARLIPYLSAKNIKNKREVVEVLVGGEKEQVESFIEFVKTDFPEDAEVDSISEEDYEGNIKTIESFSRSLSISQLSKIARTGVAMLNVQKDTNNAINKISGSHDQMLGKQDLQTEITRTGFSEMKEEIHLQRDDFKHVFMAEVNELRGEIKN